MNPRTVNLTMRIAAAALAVAGVGAWVCALLLPMPKAADPLDVSLRATTPQTQPADSVLPSAEAVAAVLDRKLRVPLTEMPGESAPGAVASGDSPASTMPAVAMPSITMVGAIGQAVALLRGPDGVVVACSVGDDIGGAKILAIHPGAVDVEFNGRSVTLEKPKADITPSPIIIDGASMDLKADGDVRTTPPSAVHASPR